MLKETNNVAAVMSDLIPKLLVKKQSVRGVGNWKMGLRRLKDNVWRYPDDDPSVGMGPLEDAEDL